MTAVELIFSLVICTIIVCVGILIKLWHLLAEIKREDEEYKFTRELDEVNFQKSFGDWLESRAGRDVATEGARPASAEEEPQRTDRG